LDDEEVESTVTVRFFVLRRIGTLEALFIVVETGAGFALEGKAAGVEGGEEVYGVGFDVCVAVLERS
jgi:hypothetical protein